MRELSLVALAERYAHYTGLSLATIGNLCGSGSTFFSRLRAGQSCTLRVARRVVEWHFSRWPTALEWPSDIPRPSTPNPAPSGTEAPRARSTARPADPAQSGTETPRARSSTPNRPAQRPPRASAESSSSGTEAPRARSTARPADPVAAVRALLDRAFELTEAGKVKESHKVELEAQQIATRLNAMGQIASSAALCMVVGCSRQAYYDAIRRYGNTDHACTRGQMANLVVLLRASGDVRFRKQQPAAAAAAEAANEAAGTLGARM